MQTKYASLIRPFYKIVVKSMFRHTMRRAQATFIEDQKSQSTGFFLESI